jgi:hypothetical protein
MTMRTKAQHISQPTEFYSFTTYLHYLNNNNNIICQAGNMQYEGKICGQSPELTVLSDNPYFGTMHVYWF